MKFRVGQIVKTTKDLKFGKNDILKKDTEMVVMRCCPDGIYECGLVGYRRKGCVYSLLTHQITSVIHYPTVGELTEDVFKGLDGTKYYMDFGDEGNTIFVTDILTDTHFTITVTKD